MFRLEAREIGMRPMHLLIRRVTLCDMKRRKVAPSDHANYEEGRWFLADDFWLLPKIENLIVDLKWPRESLKSSYLRSINGRDKTVRNRSGEITRKQAERITERLKLNCKKLVDLTAAIYASQPQWSLRNISVASGEIVAFVREFMKFVDYTNCNFDWVGEPPILGTEWRKHGWKHVTYDAIKELADNKPRLVPAPLQANLAGTPEQLMDLIRQAESRVPESAARLEFLFPDREHLALACEWLMSEKIPRARLDKIPTVAQLAGEWATDSVHNPDSVNATRARNWLHLLVSRGSVLRSSSDKGRPKVPIHSTGIRQIYKMSYALIKQIHEVKQFLAKYLKDDKEVDFHLWIFYPRLRDVIGENVLPFVDGSTSDSAARLTGLMLGISPSKVHQTIYAD